MRQTERQALLDAYGDLRQTRVRMGEVAERNARLVKTSTDFVDGYEWCKSALDRLGGVLGIDYHKNDEAFDVFFEGR
jgi:hypothetical protein